MIRNVYVVYDKLAERWNEPYMAMSDDNEECDKLITTSIIRDLKDKNSPAYKLADDLDLYHIGTYNDKTGDYNLLKVKRLVVHYSSLKGD